MKKILIWMLAISTILFLIGGLLVNNWMDTGHGRLNYKIATCAGGVKQPA